MNPRIQRIISEIGKDKSEGATTLSLRGLDALEALSDDLGDDLPEARASIVELAHLIGSIRPSMAAIGVQAVIAANRALSLISEGAKPAYAMGRAVRVEREILGQANTTIANLAEKELGRGGTAVTCSWSVTAMRSLVAIAPTAIRIGEGHRMGDGLRAARWLAARGFDVEVVPDSALPIAVRGADLVLVGADQILTDGSVVNRCSTFSLALAARYERVPFIVACQRIKLSGNRTVEIEEDRAFFGDLPDGVRGRAPIFDITPAGLVDGVLTESGRLTAAEAGAVGTGIAALRDRVFRTQPSKP